TVLAGHFFYMVLVCVLCVFFFFQAEDGIRDRNVTGVQTCALPISLTSVTSLPAKYRTISKSCIVISINIPPEFLTYSSDGISGRSEERRVGKECRSRVPRDHDTQQKQQVAII